MSQYVITAMSGDGMGVVLGVYEGTSPEDAMNKLAQDALDDRVPEYFEDAEKRCKLVNSLYVDENHTLRIFPVDIDENGDPINLSFEDLEFSD